MKKLFMILGTLAVLAVFAGCSQPSSGTKTDLGTFTLNESTALVPNQQYASTAGFPKNSDNKYYGYIYTITAVTNTAYNSYVNSQVFYSAGEENANLFKRSCKDAVAEKLKEGSFKILNSQSWLGYNAICIYSHP